MPLLNRQPPWIRDPSRPPSRRPLPSTRQAKARKQRMAQLELQRKAEVPLTDMEQMKAEAKVEMGTTNPYPNPQHQP